MAQIIPIKDLKNTSEISDLCHKSEEPIYITKNGYGDMVIMSMNVYDNMMKQLNMYKELEISENHIKEEKIKDAQDVMASIRKKYDL